MAPEFREALSDLCRAHGWSYGVLWCLDKRDPRVFVVEVSYCEEKLRGVVERMLKQVHMVGEGIIGETAVSGKHKWMYLDAYGNADNPEFSEGNAQWIHQLSAEIKTILLASLPSLGVAQFGSTLKVPESLEFIDKAKHLLELNVCKMKNFHDQHAAFASTGSSGDSYFSNDNSNSFQMNREWLPESAPSRGLAQSSSIFSQENCHNFKSYNSSISPRVIAVPVPVTSSSIGTYRGFCDQFQTPSTSRNSTVHLTNQTNVAFNDVQDILPANIRLLSASTCPGSSVITNFNANTWTKSNDLSMVEEGFSSRMGVPGLPNLVTMNSPLLVPPESMICQFSAESSSSSIQYGFQDTMPKVRSSEVSKACLLSTEKLFVPLGDPANAKPLCHEPPFASKLLNTNVANIQHLTSEHSLLLHYELDQADDLIHPSQQQPEQVSNESTGNKNLMGVISVSSGMAESDDSGCNIAAVVSRPNAENPFTGAVNSQGFGNNMKENSSIAPSQLLSDNDLFDGIELEISPNNFVQDYWNDIIMPSSHSNLSTNISECISEVETALVPFAEKGIFTECSLDQLLDSLVGENLSKASAHSYVAKNVHPISDHSSSNQLSMIPSSNDLSMYKSQVPSACLPSIGLTFNMLLSQSNPEVSHGSPKEALLKPRASCSMDTESSILNQPKKPEEATKVVKKRARPGESTRPRPKDRQQIQDRVKELREIVPNGTKCSIDALLDRTIKHMLFLQSVTKYADKLKQADEPKMIVEESGVVLKDNSCSGSTGGATWAYEVAGQTMVCPIIVEDLTPPGQMLVEMLCEERGFFLEIADIIRGFGLTILKGVMEIRDCKIWARFLVEANKDVTRMDIFLSLIQLLHQTSNTRSCELLTKIIEKGSSIFPNYQQSPMSIPVGLANRLQ